jgi:flagellar basal-body rod protein FlgB
LRAIYQVPALVENQNGTTPQRIGAKDDAGGQARRNAPGWGIERRLTLPGVGVELFTDRVGAGLQVALDGVAERQRTTADNIANSATPGYRAQRVTFEQSLQTAMSDGSTDPSSATISTVDAGTPADVNGNSVQLDAEVADSQREDIQYQALAQAMSLKLSTWRMALEK